MRFNPISLIFIKTKEYTTVHLQMSLPCEIIKCGLSFFNITPTKFLTRLHSSFSRFYFAIETTFTSPAFLDPEMLVYEVIYRTVCKMQARQVCNLKSANLSSFLYPSLVQVTITCKSWDILLQPKFLTG